MSTLPGGVTTSPMNGSGRAVNIGDLTLVFGWASGDMPRCYGASAATERAQHTHARLQIGEQV